MYYTLAHVPGGQPIGALERSFARIGAAVPQAGGKLRLMSAEV
jgi:hypothetical protein